MVEWSSTYGLLKVLPEVRIEIMLEGGRKLSIGDGADTDLILELAWGPTARGDRQWTPCEDVMRSASNSLGAPKEDFLHLMAFGIIGAVRATCSLKIGRKCLDAMLRALKEKRGLVAASFQRRACSSPI